MSLTSARYRSDWGGSANPVRTPESGPNPHCRQCADKKLDSYVTRLMFGEDTAPFVESAESLVFTGFTQFCDTCERVTVCCPDSTESFDNFFCRFYLMIYRLQQHGNVLPASLKDAPRLLTPPSEQAPAQNPTGPGTASP